MTTGDPYCIVHGMGCPGMDDAGIQCITKLQRSVWDRMAEMSMWSKDWGELPFRQLEDIYCDPFETNDMQVNDVGQNVPIEELLKQERSRVFREDQVITDDQTGAVVGVIGPSTRSPIRSVLRDSLGDDTLAGFFADCLEVLARKGPDYAGKDGSRSQQFAEAARELGIPVEKVWACYFHKHYVALMKYCRDGSVSSEGIEGRLVDAVNYLALLMTIMKEKR